MTRALAALLALLLSVAGARAQGNPVFGTAMPTTGGTFFGQVGQTLALTPYSAPAWGPITAPTVNAAMPVLDSVNLSGTSSNAMASGIFQMSLPASATLTGVGHVPALVGWAVNNGGTTPLMIGTEGKLDILGGTTTQAVMTQAQVDQIVAGSSVTLIEGAQVLLQNAAVNSLFYAYPVVLSNAPAAGYTLSQVAGLTFLTPSSIPGNITEFDDLFQPNWTGVTGYGNITAKYTIHNLDPNMLIASAAPISGPYGTELAPMQPGWATGRYYFGLAPSPTLTTFTPVVANVAFSSQINVPTRQAITHIGIEITTAVASHNVQFALYKMSGGGPVGAPLWNSLNHSTGTTGVIEETVTLTLEAGQYCLSVVTDTTGVGLRAYTDYLQSGQNGFGNGSNTSGYTAIDYVAALNSSTPSATWPTNPGFTQYPTSGVFPQIWLRP